MLLWDVDSRAINSLSREGGGREVRLPDLASATRAVSRSMGQGVGESGHRNWTFGSEPLGLSSEQGLTVAWEGGFTELAPGEMDSRGPVRRGLLRTWTPWETLFTGARPARSGGEIRGLGGPVLAWLARVEGVGVQLTRELSKLRGEGVP
jgi:hypothetical protein